MHNKQKLPRATKLALGKRGLPLLETSAATAFVIDIDSSTIEPMPALEALPQRAMQRSDRSVWFLVGLKDARAVDLANVSRLGWALPLSKDLHKRLRGVLREIAVEIAQPNCVPWHPLASRPLAASPLLSGYTMPALTPRQIQIVGMIRNGQSNKEIALSLGLSLGTVKVHVHRIFKALGVSNRVQLAMHPELGAAARMSVAPPARPEVNKSRKGLGDAP